MTERSIRITFLDVLEMTLFALILNLNALKIVTGINENGLVVGVFAAFAAVYLS